MKSELYMRRSLILCLSADEQQQVYTETLTLFHLIQVLAESVPFTFGFNRITSCKICDNWSDLST